VKVSASDKGTGKSKSITITNEVGRLTPDDIERMIVEAETYAEEGRVHYTPETNVLTPFPRQSTP
jgi:heat shock protein 5